MKQQLYMHNLINNNDVPVPDFDPKYKILLIISIIIFIILFLNILL